MKFALYRCHIEQTPYQVSMPPLGLGYIGAYVKKQCWFCEVGFFRDPETLIAWKPDIVGISSATENFNDAIALGKLFKTELGASVFIGGDHITILPHTLPESFDIGILSEGELTAVELIKLYYKRSPSPTDLREIPGICFHEEGKVIINKHRDLIGDLDMLPFPDRDLLGDKWAVPYKKQVHMITSRGCPYHCIFCSAPLQWRKVRYFSPEYVVKEIEFLRERYDPEEIYFFDDLFIGNIQRFRKICDLIREKRLHEDIEFRSYGRVDLVDESIADLFLELNFHYIDFGFESNSQPILKYLNKKNSAPEKNQRVIDLLAQRKISIGGNFIIGAPGETRELMEETRAFVERNKDLLDRCSMGPLQPIPGTRVWEYAKSRDLVSEDMDWSRFILDLDRLDMTRDPYLCETMPVEEFLSFYYEFHRLACEINWKGQIRKLAHDLERAQKREGKLLSELEELKGSRLVRLAMKLKKKGGRQ